MYLFPNPVQKDTSVVLCFQDPPIGAVALRLFDRDQNQILTTSIDPDAKQSYTINLRGIPRGWYTLHLKTDQKFGIQRLIIF